MEIREAGQGSLQEIQRAQPLREVELEPVHTESAPSIQLPPDAPDDLRYQVQVHDQLKRLNDDSLVPLPEPDLVAPAPASDPGPEPNPPETRAAIAEERLQAIIEAENGADLLLEELKSQGLDDEEIAEFLQQLLPDHTPDTGDALLGGLRALGLDDDEMARIALLPAEEQSESLFQSMLDRGLAPEEALEALAQLPRPQEPPGVEGELAKLGLSAEELGAVLEAPEAERAQLLGQLLEEKGLTEADLERLLVGEVEPPGPEQERAAAFVEALQERGLQADEIAELLGENRLDDLVQRLKDGGASDTDVEALFGALLGPEAVAPGQLSAEEAARIGSGLTGKVPQTFWQERAVDTVVQRSVEQGKLIPEQQQSHREVVERVFDAHRQADDSGQKAELPPAVLAALARDSGLSLEKLDPQQLLQATRFINEAGSLSEQQARSAKVLDNLKVLESGKLPQLELNDVKGILWDMARVGGHSLDNLKSKPGDLQEAYEKVAAGFNSGPGDYKVKIGKHDVKFSVSEDNGYVEGSGTTKGPGFWGTVGPILKTAVSVGAIGASFLIPGATGAAVALVLRGASAAISAVDAVRSGSVLGAVGAIAQGVGVGLGGVAGAIGNKALESASKTANLIAKGTQGINAVRSGSLTGLASGILSLAGTAVDGLKLGGVQSGALTQVSNTSSQVSKNLQVAGAVEGIISSSRQLGSAEAALRAAQANGDPAAIAAAEARLESARKSRTTSLLNGVSAGLNFAGERAGSKDLKTAGKIAGVGTKLVGGKWVGAATSGLGVVANFGDSASLKEIANLAQAGSNFAAAMQAEQKAQKSVKQAEEALKLAQKSGQPAAIQAAQASLDKARQGRDAAALDRFFSGEQAAEVGLAGAQGRQQREELRQATAPQVKAALQSAQELTELKDHPRAQGAFRELIDQGAREVVEAGDRLARAINSGDGKKIAEAQAHLEAVTEKSQQRLALFSQVFQPVETIPSELLGRLDLKDPELIPLVTSSISFGSEAPGSREVVTSRFLPLSLAGQGASAGSGSSGSFGGGPTGSSTNSRGGLTAADGANLFSKTLGLVGNLEDAAEAFDKLDANERSAVIARTRKLVENLPAQHQARKLLNNLEAANLGGHAGGAAHFAALASVLLKGDALSADNAVDTAITVAGAGFEAAGRLASPSTPTSLLQAANQQNAQRALSVVRGAAAKTAGGAVGILGGAWDGYQSYKAFEAGDQGTGWGKALQSVGGIAAGGAAIALAAGAATAAAPVVLVVGGALVLGGVAVELIWGKKKTP